MENIETPTQMTSGVATQLRVQGTRNSVQETDKERTEFETLSLDKEIINTESDISNDELNANALLNSAKEEGFEEALTHLADGEFEEPDDESPEIIENVENSEEAPVDPEKEMLLERISELENQIEEKLEENEGLRESLKNAEQRADFSQEMLLQMFRMMYEMIKEEEDENKKISLFELLIALIGKFMLSIVDPDGQQQKEKPSEQPRVETKKSPINFEEILQKIQEKKAGVKGPIEKQAA